MSDIASGPAVGWSFFFADGSAFARDGRNCSVRLSDSDPPPSCRPDGGAASVCCVPASACRVAACFVVAGLEQHSYIDNKTASARTCIRQQRRSFCLALRTHANVLASARERGPETCGYGVTARSTGQRVFANGTSNQEAGPKRHRSADRPAPTGARLLGSGETDVHRSHASSKRCITLEVIVHAHAIA